MLAKIEELNSDAEKAGDAGEVEQAMALMEQAKEMKDQISAVDEEIRMRQGVNKIISARPGPTRPSLLACPAAGKSWLSAQCRSIGCWVGYSQQRTKA